MFLESGTGAPPHSLNIRTACSSSIHAWIPWGVRSVTRARRPWRLRTKIKNCSKIHR